MRTGILFISVLSAVLFFSIFLTKNSGVAVNSEPESASYACVGRGGVDCSIIKSDASVTCKDGTTDETLFIFMVTQCQKEIEAWTQKQSDFITKSGCTPPSEIGCISNKSYDAVQKRLKAGRLEKSELGKIELNECRQQIKNFEAQDKSYKTCLAKNNNPEFDLPGNRLFQPVFKMLFCPIFDGNSDYDYETDTCFCKAGYFLFGGKCTEANTICKSKYGSETSAKNGSCINYTQEKIWQKIWKRKPLQRFLLQQQ